MKNFRPSASVLYMKVMPKSAPYFQFVCIQAVDLYFSFYRNTNEDHHIPQMNCFFIWTLCCSSCGSCILLHEIELVIQNISVSEFWFYVLNHIYEEFIPYSINDLIATCCIQLSLKFILSVNILFFNQLVLSGNLIYHT